MKAVASLLALSLTTLSGAELAGPLPSFFFPNSDSHSQVRFIVETPELRAGFRTDGVVLQNHGLQTDVRFVGSNPRVAIEGVEPMGGAVNFLLGSQTQDWGRSVATYHKIVYRGLYPGIDLGYSRSGSYLKSEFLVKPGSNPNTIRLEYAGAERVTVDLDGDLVVSGAGGELRENAPEIYQDSPGGRIRVNGRYRLLDRHTVGFEVGVYDRSRPLIIDPAITYCTYFGGNSMSAVTGVAVDGVGNLYVTGWTESFNFPTNQPLQASKGGGVDIFVAKLNPSGSSLLYATYIGGVSDDRAAALAVDGSGQVYVTGSTASANFPLVVPIRSVLGGGRDAFVLKLNAAGNGLVYSTYLGGSGWDQGTAIAVDAAGNACRRYTIHRFSDRECIPTLLWRSDGRIRDETNAERWDRFQYFPGWILQRARRRFGS